MCKSLKEQGNDNSSGISPHGLPIDILHRYFSMSLTLAALDLRLAEWRHNLDCISQNLLDVHSLSTYQKLTTTASMLTGTTQAQVIPALAGVTDLFQQFALLSETIDRACELRKQIPRWLAPEAQLSEIEQLLTGRSIQSESPMPLVQRNLLTASQVETALTPEQVLASMTIAFESIKTVVLSIDQIWQDLESKLIQSDQELAQLESSDATQIRQAIATLQSQIETDPLGANAAFEDQIAPRIAQLKLTLGQAEQQKITLQSQFNLASQLLQQLIQLRQQTIATYEEATEKTSGSVIKSAIAQPEIDALEAWLIRLQAKSAEGSLEAVGIGLSNWMVKTKQWIVVEQQAIGLNQSCLFSRRELRGRLDALQAKAQAKGLIEDPMLAKLAQHAKQLLYARPTPLDRVIPLLTEYEKRLNHR